MFLIEEALCSLRPTKVRDCVMKRRTALIASLIAGSALVFGVQAAPPEGKGQSQNAGRSDKGGNGNSNKSNSSKSNSSNGNSNKGNSSKSNSSNGNSNKGNSNKSNSSEQGKQGSNKGDQASSAGRSGYDSRGRNYDYFDDRRDASGRHRGGDAVTGLVYAGITATLAHGYAVDYGLTGYSSLPPGIRKNLARGKPLPPGIEKKMVPGLLLGRLPRYPGYEWRVAGSDLILIGVATAVVADILYDVFD
jgi:hypothetical protein